MPCCGTHPVPKFKIADIVRRSSKKLADTHTLTLDQKRLLGAIAKCRTPALGGHLHVCQSCGLEHPVYHSCRKRGCPNCQGLAQEKWIAAREEKILPVRHFHIILTLPSELRQLAQRHPVDVYNAFFDVIGQVFEELGRTWHGATFGWTMVLHTWTRELGYHPHIHVLVTAGGLLLDQSAFRHVRENYLFPGEVMGLLLQGKMLDGLLKLFEHGSFPEMTSSEFHALSKSARRKHGWVVHLEPPFRDASHLLGYLGRYVHRIAISDSRIVDNAGGLVTFTTRNGETKTLDEVEFLFRFVQHVSPSGFHKVRHGGLYASTRKGGRLEKARVLLVLESERNDEPVSALPKSKAKDRCDHLTSERYTCPNCGGVLEKTNVRIPALRAPPGGDNA